jgi:hypothetical protein
MAQTIKCKVIDIKENEADVGIITLIQFTDEKGFVWTKEYPIKMTDEVTVAGFKNILVEDLKRDLKPKDNISAVQAQLGKEFTISI